MWCTNNRVDLAIRFFVVEIVNLHLRRTGVSEILLATHLAAVPPSHKNLQVFALLADGANGMLKKETVPRNFSHSGSSAVAHPWK
jgi:hypothetical protein